MKGMKKAALLDPTDWCLCGHWAHVASASAACTRPSLPRASETEGGTDGNGKQRQLVGRKGASHGTFSALVSCPSGPGRLSCMASPSSPLFCFPSFEGSSSPRVSSEQPIATFSKLQAI